MVFTCCGSDSCSSAASDDSCDKDSNASQEEKPDHIPFFYKDGRIQYHRYSRAALYEECKRRQIPVPAFKCSTKKSLIRTLRLDDGFLEYDRWSFSRLQEECRRRGLDHSQKTSVLAKQLERHDAKMHHIAQMAAEPTENSAPDKLEAESQPSNSPPAITNIGQVGGQQPSREVNHYIKELQDYNAPGKRERANLQIRSAGKD